MKTSQAVSEEKLFNAICIIILYMNIAQGEGKFTRSSLGKIFSRRHFGIFFSSFSQKTGFDIPCKLSPMETICMKCQNLFSVENKIIINLSPAE